MDNRFAEMVRTIRLQLEDGGLTSDHEVLILSSTDNYPPVVAAYVSAAASLGADPILLTYTAPPPLTTGLSDAIVDAAIRADVVIELSLKSWAYTESHDRFLRQRAQREDSRRRPDAGQTGADVTRPLGGAVVAGQSFGWEEDVYHLIKLVPDPDLKERTRRAQVLIDKAQSIRLTSSLGTDLTVQRGDPDKYRSGGMPGFVGWFPADDAADGVLYYQGGFRCQFPSVIRQMAYQPIRIEVSKGTLVDIARDTEAGIMFDDWLRSHNDPNSYHFAEFAFGLDPRVELHRLDNAAVHFNCGVMIGVGTNYMPIFGTTVKAKSHVDMMHTGGEVWVDDLCAMRDGEFTEESGLRGPFAKGKDRLATAESDAAATAQTGSLAHASPALAAKSDRKARKRER